jgi:ribonuclease P protein component
MLGQRHRFHGYGSLKQVYSQGQQARGSMLSLKFKQRDPRRPYRVAVVVSRKVSKSAVTRNRIRRRIYEQVRKASEGVDPGTDLVFTAYNEQLATISADKLQAMIRDLLARVNKSA